MDLSYSEEERAFRGEVKAFLAENVTPEVAEKVRLGRDLTKADMEDWHARLNARGWLAQNWPAEFGGAAWDAGQRSIYEDCLLYTSPSPRDLSTSRMPSSA